MPRCLSIAGIVGLTGNLPAHTTFGDLVLAKRMSMESPGLVLPLSGSPARRFELSSSVDLCLRAQPGDRTLRLRRIRLELY